MRGLTGILGLVFALCVSSATTSRGVRWSVRMDSRKKPIFLFFKKKKPKRERLCCCFFVCNLEISLSFFPLLLFMQQTTAQPSIFPPLSTVF